jgi:uncharacterized protein (DUF488 family)
MKPTIYSVGYDHMTPAELLSIMDRLKIRTLIDCRSVPQSRRPGFSRKALEKLLGARYQWQGQDLGGRGAGPTDDGLKALELYTQRSRPEPLLLLCKEEAPGDCHRHSAIAVPLLARGIEVVHIYRNELVTASELQKAIVDPNYEYLAKRLEEAE